MAIETDEQRYLNGEMNSIERQEYERTQLENQRAMTDATENVVAPGGNSNTVSSKTFRERVTDAGTWIMNNASLTGVASNTLDALGFDGAANALDNLNEKVVNIAYDTSIIGMLDNSVNAVSDVIHSISNKKNKKNSTGINETETSNNTNEKGLYGPQNMVIEPTRPTMTAKDWSSNPSAISSNSEAPKTLSGTLKYLFPGSGLAVDKGTMDSNAATTRNAINIYRAYSPRLFGAPPQLTSLNDIRTIAADDGENTPGTVGDFYLSRVLLDAQTCQFVVGKALFTGGMSTIFGTISLMIKYARAMKVYDIFGDGTGTSGYAAVDRLVEDSAAQDAYINALKNDGNEDIKYTTAENIRDLDNGDAIMDLDSLGEAKSMVEALASSIESAGGSNSGSGSVNSEKDDAIFSDGTVKALASVLSALGTSLSVQQPFYTFETDWHSYIENVKMMINTAVIQLGLQNACVRIGNELIPISLGQHYGDKEPWSMYAKWITDETPGLFETGSIQGIDSLTGDTSQYVSFMIDPAGANETFQNEVGDSQVYATVINQGAELGAEISFLTNSSKNKVDDAIINIAGGAVNAAEAVLSNMTAGVGRFTAAVAGSFARTFVGNHCIYPQIFKSHTSTVSRDITIHLNASGGDPYSYLMDILVPYFFILGMVLPQLSTNNAASYSFPPLVQANIPGIWGTRLGMVTSVTVNKNQSGKDLSIHGFPLSVDVTMTVTDLQHVLMTSPQDKASAFLNNHTMFDYIAICAGVDKYRPNGAIRLTSRLALMANTIQNIDSVIGNAVLSDVSSWFNRLSGNAR